MRIRNGFKSLYALPINGEVYINFILCHVCKSLQFIDHHHLAIVFESVVQMNQFRMSQLAHEIDFLTNCLLVQ